MEQPQLGVAETGVETVQVALHWTWELGWEVKVTERLSGSEDWRRTSYRGCSEEEALQIVQDSLAIALGVA